MQVVYIHDSQRFGVLFGSFLSRETAIKLRELSGDLLFDQDGNIDQGKDWLFDWELLDPNCYARRKQQEKISINGYKLEVPQR